MLPIEAPFQAFMDTLAPMFSGRASDTTEENLQSRCRGALLMSISNKFGGLLLTTGNKSEMAVGYATIYGDMCGGFAPLKDVYKTQVYALARWRNGQGEVIPAAVIERAPSAELRDNQTDQDSLPPYAVLDDILRRFIELDEPRSAIVKAGHDRATVERVAALVLRNEYKRRQSAPGPRVTARSFGRDRRFPISSGYR
jgi:NAD+ synthase (glutamine-hydrolysing)